MSAICTLLGLMCCLFVALRLQDAGRVTKVTGQLQSHSATQLHTAYIESRHSRHIAACTNAMLELLAICHELAPDLEVESAPVHKAAFYKGTMIVWKEVKEFA